MVDYLECPKCFDIFGINLSHIKPPKMLKCGDSICKECLENILKNPNEEFCPICKAIIKKEQNIEEYTTNKNLIGVVNSCFNIPEKIFEKQEGDKPIQFNVILLGNSSVGKTTIFNRLKKDEFFEKLSITIGCDTNKYYIKYQNKRYKLIFRDPSGQEKYKAVTKNFMRQTDGVLFIFDITNEKSFYDLESWYEIYKEVNENVVGLLIGNKCDCQREVNEEEAKKFAEKLGLKRYLETLAKLDKNIKKAVACLLEEIIDSKALYNSLSSVDSHFSIESEKKEESKKKKKCQC